MKIHFFLFYGIKNYSLNCQSSESRNTLRQFKGRKKTNKKAGKDDLFSMISANNFPSAENLSMPLAN